MEYFKIQDFYIGNPYVKRGTVDSGTPVTIDLYTILGTNAHSGTVQNESATDDIDLELSTDGVTFTDPMRLSPHQGAQLENEDVHTIRISTPAPAVNVPYQVVAH